MRLAQLYLLAYNGALALSWAYVLYLGLAALATGGAATTFAATERVLSYAQSAAVLEVLHAMVGLVRSPWTVTAVQVGSRVGVLWGVLWAVPEVQAQQLLLGRLHLPGVGKLPLALGVSSMVIAWSISEVIRYSFYFCKECGYVPGLVTWLRYSGFIVLYPTGVSSELAVIWLALPYVQARHMYSIRMPNALNVAFDSTDLARAIALGYIFGLPMLFGHMLHQRKRQLGGASKAKRA